MLLSCTISWRRDQSKGCKEFFGNISYDLWNGIGEDDDEDMTKEKIIDFLNLFHVAINKKDFFNFKCQMISPL